MKRLKQSSQNQLKKTGDTFSLVSSVLSGSLQNSAGGMMEKLPSPQESEAERIFRNWDIGRNCALPNDDD